jgi:hypothetical protein
MGVDAGHGVRSPYDSIESHPQAFNVYGYISTSILYQCICAINVSTFTMAEFSLLYQGTRFLPRSAHPEP